MCHSEDGAVVDIVVNGLLPKIEISNTVIFHDLSYCFALQKQLMDSPHGRFMNTCNILHKTKIDLVKHWRCTKRERPCRSMH